MAPIKCDLIPPFVRWNYEGLLILAATGELRYSAEEAHNNLKVSFSGSIEIARRRRKDRDSFGIFGIDPYAETYLDRLDSKRTHVFAFGLDDAVERLAGGVTAVTGFEGLELDEEFVNIVEKEALDAGARYTRLAADAREKNAPFPVVYKIIKYSNFLGEFCGKNEKDSLALAKARFKPAEINLAKLLKNS